MMIDLDKIEDGTRELAFSALKWFINGFVMGLGWFICLKTIVWIWGD